MPARSQELKIGIGYHKQTGTGASGTTPTQLQTALTAGSLWNLGIGTFSAPFPQFVKESDADFFGKGHEWVTQVFPTSIDAPFERTFHLTSQNFAHVACFAFGSQTKSGPAAGAYQYICTPMDPVTDDVNLPATTVVGGIREGTGGEIIDMALIGAVCNSFTFRLQRGPGLQNSQLSSQWLGCGKYANNSGIAIPARFTEERLGAGSTVALTINGVNYLTNARFVDLEYVFSNNVIADSGYFPGSGSQSSFDIRGRMRMGRRTMSLSFQVELEAGSTELASLLAQTEGSVTITIEGSVIASAVKHTAKIELPEVVFRSFQLAEADGFVTAQVVADVQYNGSTGPAILTAITNQDEIGEVP